MILNCVSVTEHEWVTGWKLLKIVASKISCMSGSVSFSFIMGRVCLKMFYFYFLFTNAVLQSTTYSVHLEYSKQVEGIGRWKMRFQTDLLKSLQGKLYILQVQQKIYEREMLVMIYAPFSYSFQANETFAVLQKTSQQVQKLAHMVNKHSPGAPSLRSPVQPPTQSGKQTFFFFFLTLQCIMPEDLFWSIACYLISKLLVAFLPFRCSGSSADGVCIPGSISVHNTAEPKRARRWAPSWDEHSGKEAHKDLAQRHPSRYQPRRCVTRSFRSSFMFFKTQIMLGIQLLKISVYIISYYY